MPSVTGRCRRHRALNPYGTEYETLFSNRDAGRETIISPRYDKPASVSPTDTIILSRQPSEQVAGGDFRGQLELTDTTVQNCTTEEVFESKVSSFTTVMLKSDSSLDQSKWAGTRDVSGVYWTWD